MKFKWYDGVLLDSLKNGHWILLEELNLASQSVLEGLNAILDHRGTVFIPEMNMTFAKHPGIFFIKELILIYYFNLLDFRLFATQNPLTLGGGRKGLPASFMNRFTKIFVEEYTSEEYEIILKDLYQENLSEIIELLVNFSRSKENISYERVNLRDLLRFCEVYIGSNKNSQLSYEIAFNRQDFNKQFNIDL